MFVCEEGLCAPLHVYGSYGYFCVCIHTCTITHIDVHTGVCVLRPKLVCVCDPSGLFQVPVIRAVALG